MSIGEFLKQYRKAHGLSSKALAEMLDVNMYRMQKWESGSVPKAEDAKKIKYYFGIGNIQNVSEDVIQKHLGIQKSAEESVPKDVLLEQKDLLLKEKGYRIKELNETILILKEALAEYRGR